MRTDGDIKPDLRAEALPAPAEDLAQLLSMFLDGLKTCIIAGAAIWRRARRP